MTPHPHSDRYVVISSDTHAGASIADYRTYLTRDLHDEFDAWAADFDDAWAAIDTKQMDTDDDNVRIGVASFMSPYNWDSARRAEHFEADGITAEVVFPNTVPPFYPSSIIGAPAPTTAEEYRLRWAGIKAHNRWMVDFCNDWPGRRAGLAQVFFDDLDDAIAEVHWAKEAGLRGVLIPTDHFGKLVPLYEYRLDPFWAACAELGMPVHRHAIVVSNAETPEDGPQAPAIAMFEGKWWNYRGFAHLALGGVFQRHPELKFVFTETLNTWVPRILRDADEFCHDSSRPDSMLYPFSHNAVAKLDMLPSEYWRRNCWLGASQLVKRVVDARDVIGVDRIMWGADYPHHEGTWPHSKIALRLNFSDVPEAEVRQMTSENAADLYGFDLPFLQTIADEIGPTVEEVATPVSPEEVPRSTMCHTFVEAEYALQASSA
jgi:predicted TIM-barrel fold metal-dependent hydrolase